ncbi:alpha/beta hydrolase family protein [Massilia sp. TWR1-2-2]|uniref:alpha/beta hydrolase family protein n=1 Tax=Massilia sp. TWR1-2-2 TaxID=2804584 RepID=UPI003CF68846
MRYKARDGLDIPGVLTLPHGSNGKNLPMVVLVHGNHYRAGWKQWGLAMQNDFWTRVEKFLDKNIGSGRQVLE